MINNKGEFFHIDFGYFLDRDPKFYPPAFKLNDALINGMNKAGNESDEYKKFQQVCFEAFKQIRHYNKFILNLFVLMIDSAIEVEEGIGITEDDLMKMY